MIQDVKGDVRFADIGNLPSNFFPYKNEFTQLNIRQFTVADLKLLSRAATTKNVVHTLKAVDQTIDIDIKRLTIGDFYYILMWHKLHSFPKTPLTVAWECRANVALDADGSVIPEGSDKTVVKYDVCGQANAQLIHQSDIETVDLTDDFKGIPDTLDFPRTLILPEILEMRNDPDFSYLIGAAQWIKQGNTLAEKFAYLESLPNLDLYEEAEKTNDEVIHGVNEFVKIKCQRCTNTFVKKLELDPINFFRPSL